VLRYAAIDIGSNAMRMLFQQVYLTPNGPVFKKLSLIRLPVRLGEDAFLQGKICEQKAQHLVDMAHSFRHLCAIFEVDDYRATATSAMRDASNGMEIIGRIRKEAEIDIRIIPGDEEATVLCEAIFNTGKIDTEHTYVMVDVGGGSTEINFYVRGERLAWQSFNIGAVRLKEGLVRAEEYAEMENWIREKSEIYKPDYSIGTGGNINKLYKLCDLKDWAMLSMDQLAEKLDFLQGLSYEDMISNYDIKPDRADVIVDGGMVYLRVMKAAQTAEMIVPKVGLPDGLIRRMFLEEHPDNF
jgi:exopolyphosphatase/guanosine-5'-triphosphate,3'-diphosphate pyrophosphatase